MKITDITAIIAIVLSLINLGIVLKKEIFKPKPSLKFYIKNAQIRYWERDHSVAQIVINISMTPLIKYNGIKEIYLENEVDKCFGTTYSDKTNSEKVLWFYNLYSMDIFEQVGVNEFEDYVKKENGKRHCVEEIASNVDVPYNFTLMDIFVGNRYPDGYEDFPEEGFCLKIIDFFDNKYNIPLEVKRIW